MSKVEAAWLAGLFDWEGSVVFMHPQRVTPTIRISIANCNLELLERAQEVTGTGNIIVHRRAGQVKANHSASWYWQTYSATACDLLKQMLPWLIVKREKAERAISIQH